MPYIVIKSVCPNDKISQALETSFEVQKKFPPDIELVTEAIPGITKANQDGITSIQIQKVQNSRLEDALKRNISMLNLYNHIPGYRYNMDVYFSSEELFAQLGITPPG